MFVVEDLKKKSGKSANVLELPDEDASVVEIMKYNAKALYKDYLGTREKRKLALDVAVFLTSCYGIHFHGKLFAV
eukprot:snap_masked-scaffold_6-processed-gene-19.16-mRNA-1 protein AED:0.01 eAED:0.01 QI:0/-1/0/1/-1/1/1/0/74